MAEGVPMIIIQPVDFCICSGCGYQFNPQSQHYILILSSPIINNQQVESLFCSPHCLINFVQVTNNLMQINLQ